MLAAPEGFPNGGSRQARGRVLVVEDDDDTRAALSDALSDLGHVIVSHPDGASALERLDVEEFDAVLTDVRMPGMDGIELCRRLSGDRPHLPIVVMTAFGDVESALGALRAGAVDFLTKPLSLQQLADALDRALMADQKSPIVVRPAPGHPLASGRVGLAGSSSATRQVLARVAEVAPSDATSASRTLDEVERNHILLVLDTLRWNKAEAARILGINRATLYRKLQRYGLSGPSN